MKDYTFHVSGTHCASCKIFIEDTLTEQTGISHVCVDLKHKTVSLETTLDETQGELAERLTATIQQNGYALSVLEPVEKKQGDGVVWLAVPIGLAVLALFFLFQKSGILNIGLGGTVTPVTALIIGLIASVSSCLAVVGGLVLSLSATISRDSQNDTRPILLFHGGRLLGFAVLGGILGVIGGALSIGLTATTLLGLLASVVMILLGLNLVGIFEKSTLTLPLGIFKFFRSMEHTTLAPFLLGVGTFFLPCGFTQAMQVTALSSGSFLSGLLIMGAFAIGTLPMLALLSFGSASFAQSKHAPLFFKSAGVVVLGLGSFAFLAGLAGLGIINPLITL